VAGVRSEIRIAQAIEVEEADINKRCYVAIVSLPELKSLDRR
jgi:hypothetical protein